MKKKKGDDNQIFNHGSVMNHSWGSVTLMDLSENRESAREIACERQLPPLTGIAEHFSLAFVLGCSLSRRISLN